MKLYFFEKETSMKKILCVVLMFLLLLPVVSSCRDSELNAEESQSLSDDASEAVLDALAIVENGKSDAIVVYPAKDLMAEELAESLCMWLQNRCGVNLRCASDTYMEADAGRVELLVGETNREESKRTVERIERTQDYICELIGNKLVLVGGSDSATQKAVKYFMSLYPAEQGQCADLLYFAKDNVHKVGTYSFDLPTCNGVSLAEYTIVYPKGAVKGEYYVALNLQYHLYRKCGVLLAVTDDFAPAAKNEILVGQTNRQKTPTVETGKFSLTVRDGSLCIAANDFFGFLSADEYLTTSLFHRSNQTKSLTEDYSYVGTAQTMPQKSGDFRVIFNNCWGVANTKNHYYIANRDEYAAAMYLAYQPDVIALNEYWDHMRSENVLHTTLIENGYAEVDVSADWQYGNVMPVFYNPERLTVVKVKYVHYKWYTSLSSETLSTADHSKGATIVVFEDKQSGERFIICNTHFAANTNGTEAEKKELGQKNRLLHIQSAMEALEPIIAEYPEASVLLGCDYNAVIGSEECNTLMEEYGFVDCHDTAENKDNDQSHHNYPDYDSELQYYVSGTMPSGGYKSSIDHIFRLGDTITEHTFDTLTTKYSTLFSDHAPLLLDFSVEH